LNAKNETRLQKGERLLRVHRRLVFDEKAGPAHVRAIIRLKLLLTPAFIAASFNEARYQREWFRHA
jgi:hypothetical protein